MAHKNFAQLNENNLVINVLKCDDTETVDSLLKKGLNCVEATSGVQKGDTWQSENNRFINAQPYDNWTLNNETGKWEAPVAEPTSIYVDSNNNSIELKYIICLKFKLKIFNDMKKNEFVFCQLCVFCWGGKSDRQRNSQRAYTPHPQSLVLSPSQGTANIVQNVSKRADNIAQRVAR